MNRLRSAAAVAAALTLLTIGCGGGNGDEAGEDPATTEVTSTTRVVPAIPTAEDIEISSPDFDDGGVLPSSIVCEELGGDGHSPALDWDGIPPAAANLVLVVHDLDAPIDGGFTHVIARFEPTVGGVEEGADANLNHPMGRWIPVCPPPGEEHRYTFTLYVFPADVGIPARAAKADLDILSADAIGQAQITGRYAAPPS